MSTAMSMMHSTITVHAGQNTEHFIVSWDKFVFWQDSKNKLHQINLITS